MGYDQQYRPFMQDGQPQQQEQWQPHQPSYEQGHTRMASDDSDTTIVSFIPQYNMPEYQQLDGFDQYNVTPSDRLDRGATEQSVLVDEPLSPTIKTAELEKHQASKWSLRKQESKPSSHNPSSRDKGSRLTSQNVTYIKTETWTFEIISLVIAVGAVASIIAVLAAYDRRPLPSWPYDITLNALIAVLTTIANAAMAVPLSSGLGQVKWERFKTGYAPLTDLEYLDDASRGALGAFNLLTRFRGG